jgi:hypothetical protein
VLRNPEGPKSRSPENGSESRSHVDLRSKPDLSFDPEMMDLDCQIQNPHVIRSSAPEVLLRGKCGLRIEIPEGRFAKQISVVDSKREDLIRRSKAPELGR